MSTATPALVSFTSGEISERLDGRIDIKWYAQGCDTLINFVNLPHGGLMRRSGLRFVHEAGSQTSASQLVPFEYNTEQAYVLEFYENADGHVHMRVFKDQGIVLSGGNPYDIRTPYEPAVIGELRYVQDNNTLYIVHKDYAPRTLTRSGHTSWTFATMTLTGQPLVWGVGNYPRLVCFHESRLVFAATPNEPTTLWFSQVDNYTNFLLNTREVPLTGWGTCYVIDTDADGVKNGTDGDTFIIPSGKIFSSESVDLNAVKGTNPSGDVRYFKYIGAKRFDAASSAKTITFKATGATGDQIEAIYIGSDVLNSTYWEAWEIGDRRTNNEGDPRADDGMEFTLKSSDASALCWIAPKDKLWIGAANGTWTFGAASANEGLSPDNPKASFHSSYGSIMADAAPVGSATLYIQRGGRKVREMAYNFNTDNFESQDLNILADHITDPGVSQIAFAQDPDSILYARLSDGDMVSLTYMRDQEVLGWSNVVTSGDIESIACIFGSTDSRTELWVQTERVLDGDTRRFIEFMEGPHTGADTEDAFFVDAGISYDGAATTVLSGASHLAGATVQVLADGAVHPDVVVASNGTITLSAPASVVHAGLAYESRLRTMRLEAGSDRGTSQSKRKAVTKMTVRFMRTLGGKIGLDDSRLETLTFRTTADQMDAPPALFSGDKTVTVPKGWAKDCRLVVVQDQPLPMNILMLVPEVTANE